MGETGFVTIDQARCLIDSALSAVRGLRDGAFWKLLPDDLLDIGRELETLARTVYATQIHLAGEIDTRDLAGTRSCSSTPALLRQAFNISHADAIGRVKAARQLLPRDMLAGPDAPPALPMLADAVDGGRLGSEHIRTIVETMAKIPQSAPARARDACERALVDTAVDCDPNFLERAARRILERADPDGDLDDSTPAAKMGLDFGGRNIRTGLTAIKGLLDDHGVEVIKKAIDGLSAPTPETGGIADTRSPSNRRAHGLVEALRRYLDAGSGPTQGGERPHLTIILQWDVITRVISDAGYDTGGALSPAQARRFLCDAQITPAVLGSTGEVLDLGRTTRTFSAAIRRAITVRDRGCIWPGCDRPPHWCDGHHVQFWGRDFGPTSYANGVLLCPYHHSEIHKGEWVIAMARDGIPELVPPKWVDPVQTPRRNRLHHLAVREAP